MFLSAYLAAAAVGIAYAAPVTIVEAETPSIQVRQDDNTSANDYVNGGCKDVILFFARGTNQSGNIGEMPGPDLVAQLKSALGSDVVAAQGIEYEAALLTNLLEGGCDPAEAADMANTITQAAGACPASKLVVSGYSQGAAMVHASIESLSDSVKAQIAAAVTFGDTQKQQDGGQIPNFDTAKTLILCNEGDKVCEGTLIITDAHTDYTSSVPTAVTFIEGKVA
ncbi:hypothetical protein JX265_013467 [Neoarthrinium moseri]|uniref:Cutinase n=1 Tax=Neoarthrinium moseri TaxID=1658444 RepID=A0A9Q0AIQ9_9PEZI|nr:uncharacterized protein JN550_013026 [Neoarthrinium moseri]KAI1841367.1 hypothetical protein JX266_012448 [Neoarthrinium moseri]KAI1850188.1 hypothetical protein JX265_013467 [Neoarthrinium moseri]KAI1857828.1 hypothetical protein JN550_013026 [Neoarthrinium moseri]